MTHQHRAVCENWAIDPAGQGVYKTIMACIGMRTLVYRTATHPLGVSKVPDYEIVDGDVFPMPLCSDGPRPPAMYTVVAGRLYRTASHPEGAARFGDYEINDNKIYRTTYHRLGLCRQPDYAINKEPA